jgi:hypothetical protein
MTFFRAEQIISNITVPRRNHGDGNSPNAGPFPFVSSPKIELLHSAAQPGFKMGLCFMMLVKFEFADSRSLGG